MGKSSGKTGVNSSPECIAMAKALYLEIESDGEGGFRRVHSLEDISELLRFGGHSLSQPSLSIKSKEWRKELPEGVHHNRGLSPAVVKTDLDGRDETKKKALRALERALDNVASITVGLKSKENPMTHKNFTKDYKEPLTALVAISSAIMRITKEEGTGGKAGNTYNIQLNTTPARQSKALRDILELSSK